MKQLTSEQIGIDYRAWLDLRMLVGGWSYPPGPVPGRAASCLVACRSQSHKPPAPGGVLAPAVRKHGVCMASLSMRQCRVAQGPEEDRGRTGRGSLISGEPEEG